MAYHYHTGTPDIAFARYRAGLALDRLTNASSDWERHRAVKWALAWSRLATEKTSRLKKPKKYFWKQGASQTGAYGARKYI